jgi:hypothetical protein
VEKKLIKRGENAKKSGHKFQRELRSPYPNPVNEQLLNGQMLREGGQMLRQLKTRGLGRTFAQARKDMLYCVSN